MSDSPSSSDAEAHRLEAQALRAQGRAREALEAYDRAIALELGHALTHHHKANTLAGLGDFAPALLAYSAAVALDPALADAHINRGVVLRLLGQAAAALESYDAAIAACPDHAEAYYNRGNALRDLGRPEEAAAAFARAAQLRPDHAPALANHGLVLRDLGDDEGAQDRYEAAIAAAPGYAPAWINRGLLHRDLGHPDLALADFEAAIQRDPALADAHVGRGLVLKDAQRIDDALAAYDRALTLNPHHAEAHWNKALALLLGGRWLEAWPHYEQRWRLPHLGFAPRELPQPLWSGQPLEGRRVFVHAEQGLGDLIQFSRYARLLVQQGAKVLLEAPPSLWPVLDTLGPGVVMVDPADPPPQADFQIPLMSLPMAFGTTPGAVPMGAPYLAARPDRVALWRERLDSAAGPLVGLVWKGAARYRTDHLRSLPLADLLAALPVGPAYVALQKDLTEPEQALLAAQPDILAAGGDFADTAALASLMDVVVSVDTSVAHLSGAIGAPTWVLLPFASDWRWLLNRDETPWYESVRLYRQGADRSWGAVLARVAEDLKTRL